MRRRRGCFGGRARRSPTQTGEQEPDSGYCSGWYRRHFMASEQVRLASKALGPLVRRHGTSPALKVTRHWLGHWPRLTRRRRRKPSARRSTSFASGCSSSRTPSVRPIGRSWTAPPRHCLSWRRWKGLWRGNRLKFWRQHHCHYRPAHRSVCRHIPILRRRRHQRVFPGPRLPKQKTRHGRFCRNLSISRQFACVWSAS